MEVLGRWPAVALALLLSLALVSCSPLARAADPPLARTPEPAARVSGSGAVLPLVQRLAEAYREQRPDAQFRFDSGTNSGGAILG